MNHPNRIAKLLFGYTRNELTENEKKELADWRALSTDNEQLFRDKTDPEKVRSEMTALYNSREEVFQQIKNNYPGIANAKLTNHDFPEPALEKQPVRIFHLSRKAAAIITILGVSSYFILRHFGLIDMNTEKTYDAVFVSPDGIETPLDDAHRGFLSANAGISFKENEKGEDDYIASENPNMANDKHYTLRSKKGGHFRLNLPGSAWIWFNSATSIQYPANLLQDTLQVQLTGEAYFEVKRDSAHPVIISLPVAVNDQRQSSTRIKIESSKAQFNVKAYSDSSTAFITAVSGNVFLRLDSLNGKPPSRILLFPGQQVKWENGSLSIPAPVNLDQVIGWKK
jgi:ferric-dicitrate binding protein FerR (iron transport regulator)